MAHLIQGIKDLVRPSPSPQKPGSTSKDDSVRRTKRKVDPYDDLEDGDDGPILTTPSAQRVRSRVASEAPSSSRSARPSVNKINKRRSRSQSKRPSSSSSAPPTSASQNKPRSKAPTPARVQASVSRGSAGPKKVSPRKVLVADIINADDDGAEAEVDKGGGDQPPTDGKPVDDEPAAEGPPADNPHNGDPATKDLAPEEPAIEEPAAKPAPKDKPAAKGKQTAKAKARPSIGKKPVERDAEKLLVAALDEGRNDEADGVHEVEKLLKYRRLTDGSVELLVKWADEPETDATFEPEEEIQKGAAETLYAFWKKQGGRTESLFLKGKNPPSEQYFTFKILRHEKVKAAFQFEVQWVGYPDTPGNTSWEPETKLKKIASSMLEKYWESQGGRDKFLARRGRAKRTKTG